MKEKSKIRPVKFKDNDWNCVVKSAKSINMKSSTFVRGTALLVANNPILLESFKEIVRLKSKSETNYYQTSINEFEIALEFTKALEVICSNGFLSNSTRDLIKEEIEIQNDQLFPIEVIENVKSNKQ